MKPTLFTKREVERRIGNTQKVLALFRSRPLQWIPWTDLADVGGHLAWRTRVSQARQIVKRDGGAIEWNRKLSSAYRYLPQAPQGRDAGSIVAPTLFELG